MTGRAVARKRNCHGLARDGFDIIVHCQSGAEDMMWPSDHRMDGRRAFQFEIQPGWVGLRSAATSQLVVTRVVVTRSVRDMRVGVSGADWTSC